jgi:hypothetical protein
MAGRTLTVYLAADTDKFRREMREAQGQMGNFQGAVGRFSGAMGTLFVGALAGAGFALGNFAKDFAVDGIKAAAENEAAMAKLTKQLDLLGLAADAPRVELFIDALSRASGVADDELYPSFSNLARITGDTDYAMQLLSTALDVATGTGKPLSTVVEAIGKAAGGTTGPLSRLVPELKNIAGEGASADDVLGVLSERFEGQYKTAAETYEGKIGRVKIAFDELKESFGTGFLEALDTANGKTGDYASTIQEFEPFVKELGKRFGEIATAIGTVTTFVIDAKDKFDDWYASLDGFNKFIVDTLLNTLYTMVNPINALIGAIQTAIDKFRELMSLMGQQTPAAINGQGTPGRPLPSTRSAARVTESAVGTAIYRVLANTDARNGYTPGAVLA